MKYQARLKRVLSLLLAVCLALSLALPAMAAETVGSGPGTEAALPGDEGVPNGEETTAPEDTPEEPVPSPEQEPEQAPAPTEGPVSEDEPEAAPAPTEEPADPAPTPLPPLEEDFLTEEEIAAATEWIEVADVGWYNPNETEFTISTARQLAGLAKLTNGGNSFLGCTITLANDIDLAGKNWTPIGFVTSGAAIACGGEFLGVFDGKGNTISNLECRTEETVSGAGLFGHIRDDVLIKNLNLTINNVEAIGETSSAGGLVAYYRTEKTQVSDGTILNCRVTVKQNGKIKAQSANAGHSVASGMVAVIYGGAVIRDCFVNVEDGATILSDGTTSTGNNTAGGYIGYSRNSVIERSRLWLAGTITADSDAKCTRTAGGFLAFGNNTPGNTIRDSYVIVTATGAISVTGVEPDSHLQENTGLIAGSLNGSCENVYAVNLGSGNFANLKPGISMGLIGGRGYGGATVTNAYAWSADENYPLFADESGFTVTNAVKAATEAEMKQEETYKGFNFVTTWVMDSATGYPKIGAEVQMSDAEVVAKVKANLGWDSIKGENTDAKNVLYALDLPSEGLKGSSIRWGSKPEGVVRADGSVSLTDQGQTVTLIAYISKGSISDQKSIVIDTGIQAAVDNWANLADTSWYDPTKTEFSINTAAALAGVAKLANNGISLIDCTITLTENIDLQGKEWTPIGCKGGKFEGTFDGAGHTVANLSITNPDLPGEFVGLFGVIRTQAVVKNLGIVSGLIISDAKSGDSGAIAGAQSLSKIYNCYSLANVTKTSTSNRAGGVVGVNSYSRLANCWNGGTVEGKHVGTGGVAAINNNASMVYNTFSYGICKKDEDAGGGVFGQNMGKSTAAYSYWNNAVTANGILSSDATAMEEELHGMEAAQMQTQSFVDTLNGNLSRTATGTGIPLSELVYWVIPEAGGYPVLAFDMPDEEVAAKGLDYVSWDAIKGDNADQNSVMSALSLVREAPQGVTIIWTASPAGVVDVETGLLTLPENAQQVTLTATAVKNGTSQSKTIEIRTGDVAGSSEWISVADTAWFNDTQNSFEISNARQLAGIAKLVNEGNHLSGVTFTLTDDIDLSGKNWTPIGYSIGNNTAQNQDFRGALDGAGHTISNLNCQVLDRVYASAGLFGSFQNSAQVKNLNLTVDCSRATGTLTSAGGLIGYVNAIGILPADGNILNCRVTVNAGGIIESGTTASHSATGAFIGVAWAGSLVIRDCFADVLEGARLICESTAVSGQNNAAGYIGFAAGGSVIERSRLLLKGSVSVHNANAVVSEYVGGFLGYGLGGNTIRDCYTILTETAKIEITGTATAAVEKENLGLIAGPFGGTVENVYAINQGTGNLITMHPENKAGLLGGRGNGNPTIKNAYAWSADGSYPLFEYADTFVPDNCKLLTAEKPMKEQGTYVGFDFATTWVMDTAGTGYPQIGKELTLTDEEIVEVISKNLSWDTIKGKNTDMAAVVHPLELLTEGLNGATITWASDKPTVISTSGKVAPASETESAKVVLTATIRYGTAESTKNFTVTVSPGFNWDNFWSNYWGTHSDVVWATVGDSITCSNINLTKGHRYYFEWVQERLNGELGKNVTVINPAISGWKLDQFDDAAKDWVNDYKADVVTVYFGMNDRNTADLAAVKAHLKNLVEQLLPTKENQGTYGTPVYRVIVLIACNPVKGGADGVLRDIHAYGEELAQQYTARGYKVQCIDLYDYYKSQLKYGKNGNLAAMSSYYYDNVHVNAVGNYATAQYLMENMGLYNADSKLCNYRHDALLKEAPAPYAGVNYLLANSGVDGEDYTGALTNSAGYTALAAENAYGTGLILGGAVTSGTVGDMTGYRSWAWHVESYLRTVNAKSKRHLVTVADESYGVSWFNSKFNDLKWQYDDPSFILYMPEVNELYTDSYVHSSDKVTTYKTQLGTFVDKCAAANIELTLMTPFPMQDETKNGYLEDYVRAVVEVANEKKVSLNNAYSALGQVMNTPQGRRNWYAADGYPNYIAQIEAAKTFLTGSCGEKNNTLFQYTYRNASRTSGTQYDNFDLASTKGGDTVHVDLTAVLADPFYSSLKAPTAANFGVERTTAAGVTAPVAFTYDPEKKVLSYSASSTGELDAVRVKIVNGATTYLNAYTPADVEDEGVTVSSSASFGAGMVPQLEALTSAEGLTISEASAVSGDYTLTCTEGTYGEAEQKSVTFAITKTGESKAAVSVTLVDASAEQAADLSNVTITFKAGRLEAQAFTFDLNTVPAGTYSVATYKKNHTTATMTGITVGDAAVTLGQDMEMYAGDLNDDGKVTIEDKGLLVGQFNNSYEAFDLNDDGNISIEDKGLLVGQFNNVGNTLTWVGK